jgi:2'-5' RNA ligase
MNWTELQLPQLKDEITKWMARIPADLVDEVTEDPHITVLYGCNSDPSVYNHLKLKDIQWETSSVVRPGDVSDVLLVGIKSQELNDLFMKMYKDDNINTAHQHRLINGKYDPHLTLAWLKKGARVDPRIIDICNQYPFPKNQGTSDVIIRIPSNQE